MTKCIYCQIWHGKKFCLDMSRCIGEEFCEDYEPEIDEDEEEEDIIGEE